MGILDVAHKFENIGNLGMWLLVLLELEEEEEEEEEGEGILHIES